MLVVAIMAVFAVSELLLSPIGLSVTTKLAPEAFRAQMMALYFFSVGLGTSMSGVLASYYDPAREFAYFGIIGAVAIRRRRDRLCHGAVDQPPDGRRALELPNRGGQVAAGDLPRPDLIAHGVVAVHEFGFAHCTAVRTSGLTGQNLLQHFRSDVAARQDHHRGARGS